MNIIYIFICIILTLQIIFVIVPPKNYLLHFGQSFLYFLFTMFIGHLDYFHNFALNEMLVLGFDRSCNS